MWYKDRTELDLISKAGVHHYINELGNPVVRMNASFWLECEKDDTAFTQPAMNTGNWEAWVATAIMNEFKSLNNLDEPWFFDVGANNGYYSMMVASAGYDVCSYEPNKDLIQMIKRSASLNNITGYHGLFFYPYAVSDTNNERKILHTHENHSGAASLEGEGEGFEVNTITLDKSAPVEDAAVVIKVDVEGHERNVWRGAERIRALKSNVWFLEWVPCRHGIEYNREWLEEVLETHDLQMVDYDGSLKPVGIEEALAVEFETIVFRKRN